MHRLCFGLALVACCLWTSFALGDGTDDLFGAISVGDFAKVKAALAAGADINKRFSTGDTPLLWSMRSRQNAITAWLLAHGADVNAKSNDGEPPLYLAASNGDDDIATLILTHDPDVNAKAENGDTALHVARTRALAESLIAHGAKVNIKNKGGDTPLHDAARANRRDIVDLLVAHGATDDLFSAAYRGEIEKCKSLLAQGGDANAKDQNGYTPLFAATNKDVAALLLAHGADVNARSSFGYTPLFAISDKDVAALLIAHGADVKVVDQSGASPLFVAANKDIANLLVSKGVDVNGRNKAGEAPLHWAALFNREDVAEVLIAHGADVNATNQYGGTPLQWARSKEVAELLIAHGAGVNSKDKTGETPVYAAVRNDRKDVVAVLLAHGASVNTRNSSEETPLHPAAYFGYTEVVAALVAHRADVNARDKDGKTPLFGAVETGHDKTVALLLDRGADPNVKDKDGDSLLDEAVDQGREQIVRLLLAHGASIATHGYSKELYSAVYGGRVGIVNQLLDHGADVNAKDKYGYSQLSFTTSKEVAEALIAHGADVNAKDNSGYALLDDVKDKGVAEALITHGADVHVRFTGDQYEGYSALHFAARDDRTGVAEALLGHGADAMAKDDEGQTPLYLAKSKRMVEILLAHGAVLNARDKLERTPLLDAAYDGKKEVVEALIAHGADVNGAATDDPFQGYTPLHFAAMNGHAEVARVLIAAGADLNAKTGRGETALQLTNNIYSAKKKDATVAVLQAGIMSGGKNQRETLADLLSQFKGHAGNEALRLAIIKTAKALQPAPAIPDEAVQHAGRAQYVFQNAKSNDDVLSAAKEYLEAIELAPWVANDYYNLCIILNKTPYTRADLHACRLYLEATSNSEDQYATNAGTMIAGLGYQLEHDAAAMDARTAYMKRGVDLQALYRDGGIFGQVAGKNVAIKLAVNWQAVPPAYEVLLACMDGTTDVYTDTQKLVNTDRYTNVCAFKGGPDLHLVVKSDGAGFVELADASGSSNIHATLDELYSDRVNALKQSPIFHKYGEHGGYYVALLQGGADERYAGYALYASDCRGELLRSESHALPDDFLSLKSKGSGGLGDYQVVGSAHNMYTSQDVCQDEFETKTGYSGWGANEK